MNFLSKVDFQIINYKILPYMHSILQGSIQNQNKNFLILDQKS